MCVTPLVTDPSPKYFIAVGSVILAIIIYFFIVYKRYQPKWMGKYIFNSVNNHFDNLFIGNATFLVQVLLEVTAAENTLQQDKAELCIDKKSVDKLR